MKNFLSRFVDSNEREIHKLRPMVDAINALEAEFQPLSDQEIRERMIRLRAEIQEEAAASEPSEEELEHPERARRRELRREREEADTQRLQEILDDALPEVFAAGREVSRRKLSMRHFDVQLMGAIVLHQGKIAEMKTGEGKTLAAPLAAALNAMSGRGVHVVTVNDYLAKRDPQWMGPLFHGLGLSVGIIQHESAFLFDPDYRATDERLMHLRPVERQEAYAADVTYGTNNEFGFDYLRDNMVQELSQRVQRGRFFAIVDEVDNILIDEARTPLIISGQAEESEDLYYQFARLAPRLAPRPEGAEEGGDYFVDLKEKSVAPTEEGVAKIERLLGVENLYAADPRLARHFDQALRAHALYKRDRDYIVKDGEIIIVDEFTGRQMPGRRWSEGLHQAIEAKEGLRVQRESVTLATITFQNYFRLYDKLAGMTGTAMTEAEEFYKIYGIDVVAIPTHREMIRDDAPDLVFRTEQAKFNAVIDEIEQLQAAGRPVLVGTVTVEKSEILGELLRRRGIKHEVLNAKFHEKEAEIVAHAGRLGSVTISTNMAGRGTDIKLGGDAAGLASDKLKRKGINPAEASPEVYAAALAEAMTECAEEHDRVVAAGGLHIIGTERHDARRIDNQLRGRAGRQGDPGSSRFYLSLEDPLMKRFASDRVASFMERMGLDDETAIESRIVSRTVESAQTRVEGYNFDLRKRVVEFDDVINKQRETIYAERDKVLHNEDLTDSIRDFLDDEIQVMLDTHLAAEQPDDWDMEGLSKALVGLGLDPVAVEPDTLWDLGGRSTIQERLTELVDEALERKEAEVGEETWALVEKLVLLRAIDSLWVEHLTELDDMRKGVGLRGYGGEDPLNVFRKVAFQLYEELRGFIRDQVSHTILRVQVQAQPTPQAMPLPGPGQRVPAAGNGTRRGTAEPAALVATSPLHAGGSTTGAAGVSGSAIIKGATSGTSAAAVTLRDAGVPGGPSRPGPMRLEAGGKVVAGAAGPVGGGVTGGRKLGRNDPCWCGSGLKYKKCHGR